MVALYGVLCVIALALFVGLLLNKQKNIWLTLLSASIFVCFIGYFIISVSRAKWLALMGNSVAYLGNVFLPYFLLMMVFDVFSIKAKKAISISYLVLAVVVLVLTISPAFCDLYYKTVNLAFVSGCTLLVKTYGKLHFVYVIYLLVFFLHIFVITIWAMCKNRTAHSTKQAMFILCVLLSNLLIWLLEKFIKTNFEFLTISYLTTEVLLMFLYSFTNDFNNARNQQTNLEELTEIQLKYGFDEKQIESIIENWKLVAMLTDKEKEILPLLLKNEKRKNIAKTLFISENTVKKHTASVFKKLKVQNRNELFKKAQTYISKA